MFSASYFPKSQEISSSLLSFLFSRSPSVAFHCRADPVLVPKSNPTTPWSGPPRLGSRSPGTSPPLEVSHWVSFWHVALSDLKSHYPFQREQKSNRIYYRLPLCSQFLTLCHLPQTMQIGKYLWNAYNMRIFLWEQREYKDGTVCVRKWGRGRAQSRRGTDRRKQPCTIKVRNKNSGTNSCRVPKRRVQLGRELDFPFIVSFWKCDFKSFKTLYLRCMRFQNWLLLPLALCGNCLHCGVPSSLWLPA